MKKNLLLFFLFFTLLISLLLITSCDSYVKKTEYNKLKSELDSLKNIPQVRYENALKLYHNNDLEKAKSEFEFIINKFNYSDESKKSKKTLVVINNKIKEVKIAEEKKRITEEKNKNLKFLKLKPNSSVTIENIKVKFKNIKVEKKWKFEFENNNSRWSYRRSERGAKFITVNTIISSEKNETKIPFINVYKLDNGKLINVGNMDREFLYEDSHRHKIDFRYTEKVYLSHSIQLDEELFSKNDLFIVVKKTNCSPYKFGYYLDTDTDYRTCNINSYLSVNDFENEYQLIKILNKK